MKKLSWFVVIVMVAVSFVFTACEGDNGNDNPATYAVIYDGNGSTTGSVPVDSNEYEDGQIVTVLGNPGSLMRSGYSFAGWCVSKEGTGDSYAEGQTFTIGNADVTLYAKWTANPTYTVIYDRNGSTGGSVPPDSTHYEQGQTVTVMSNSGNLVRNGYTFAGWCLNNAGTGTTYTGGQTFTMNTADVTLYAKWTANPTYTVTYNSNGSTGGSVPPDTTHYEQGQGVTVLGNIGNLVRSGYTFAGWCLDSAGTGMTYTGGQTFVMGNANVTLYAKWAATYTVTYNGNSSTGGGVPTDGNRYQQGQTVTVQAKPANLVRKAPWDADNTKMMIFLGWNTNSDGSGTNYSSGNTFNMGGGNVTLYANWTAIGVVGPAGGYIFYEKGDSEGRYYEAAPQSTEQSSYAWGPTGVFVQGTQTVVGSGETNTGAIWMMLHWNYSYPSSAAKYCYDLTYGGCDDWFLPSWGELQLIGTNLYSKSIGGFTGQLYWTSSEVSADEAYSFNVQGFGGNENKSTGRRVRAVRRFN